MYKKTGFRRLIQVTAQDNKLFLSGSSDRAGPGTGTAFDAGFRIDFVFSVALFDSGNRALGRACAAADTFVRNFVSHFPTSRFYVPWNVLIH